MNSLVLNISFKSTNKPLLMERYIPDRSICICLEILVYGYYVKSIYIMITQELIFQAFILEISVFVVKFSILMNFCYTSEVLAQIEILECLLLLYASLRSMFIIESPFIHGTLLWHRKVYKLLLHFLIPYIFIVESLLHLWNFVTASWGST